MQDPVKCKNSKNLFSLQSTTIGQDGEWFWWPKAILRTVQILQGFSNMTWFCTLRNDLWRYGPPPSYCVCLPIETLGFKLCCSWQLMMSLYVLIGLGSRVRFWLTGKNLSWTQTIGHSGFKFLHNIAISLQHNISKAFQDTCHPLEVIQVAPEPLLDQLSRFV